MKNNSILLLMAGVLLLTGCGSKRIYDETGYLYNPTGVWNTFSYAAHDSYEEATAELRIKLKQVWRIRHALGRYTKAAEDDVNSIVGKLVPEVGECADGNKGVAILLHGLYDSPYTMKDLATFFRDKGYHTRLPLLPGHGTVPGDLRRLDHRQWIDAVEAVVEQTGRDCGSDKFVFVGFSTGAGLALNYALDHPDQTKALFLFAPLVNLPVKPVLGAQLAEALGEFVQKGEEVDTFKYESVPANSVLQANRVAKLVEYKLRKEHLRVPVFIAQAKNDYTLPSEATIALYNDKAFGPGSVFLLYSPVKVEGFNFQNCDYAEQNVFSNTSKVACNSSFVYIKGGSEATIDDYSHMSLILSPIDAHYGIDGNYRYCLQYRKGTNLIRCRTGSKPDVCYGERGLFRGQHVSRACQEYQTVIIRLTSNPKFEHLKKQLSHFMEKQKL